MTLLDWLIKKFPAASKQTLRRMVENGRVSVNGSRARSVKVELKESDAVQVRDSAAKGKPAGRSAARSPARKSLPIVLEDDDVLVIDKPPGLLTSTVEHEKRPTALAAVREYLAETQPDVRVGLIHRLDRDASGLIIFSKDARAYHSLKEQFFRHTVDRIYHAVVHGVPSEPTGRMKTRLVESNDGTVKSTVNKDSKLGQLAITEYQMLRHTPDKSRSLVRVKLYTGRKHQIRAHLSERGMPIVNDRVYSKRVHKGRLMLAATALAFDHPRTGERTKVEIPLPGEMAALVRAK